MSVPQVGELTGHEPTSQEFVGFTDEIGVTERPVSARDREAPMARIVVLDTSALMSDPDGIFDAYPGADMVVPLTVVQ